MAKQDEKVEGGSVKPVALKQGMPVKQHNGLFGMEQELIDAADPALVTAIVVFERAGVPGDFLTGDRHPVVAIKHIEPIQGDREAEVVAIRDEAYKARTGKDQLDFGDEDGAA